MVITAKIVQRAHNLTREGLSDGRAVSLALSEVRARFDDPGDLAETTIALCRALALYSARVISSPVRKGRYMDSPQAGPQLEPLPPALDRSLKLRAQTKATVTKLLERQSQYRTFTPRITVPACSCGHLATVHERRDDGPRSACQFGGDDRAGHWTCHCSDYTPRVQP